MERYVAISCPGPLPPCQLVPPPPQVRVVQHKQTRDLYALKYINKAKCVKMKAVANIIQERRLLEEIDHAFVVNMRYAFQDDENCFFVLDLMLGGDLRCALAISVQGALLLIVL